MTAPTTPDADFDPAALDAFLRRRLGGLEGELELRRISGGQSNPTYFVSYRNRRLVLRKKPSGAVLPSAHAVEREYRIQSALAGVFPVPAMVLLCEDPAVIGAAFYVMERVEGQVFSDCALPGFDPGARRSIYLNLAETLAALHRIDVEAVGLADYGKPHGYYARQLKRWSGQWDLTRFRDAPDIDELKAWLEANPPPDDGASGIVHGDYRLGNVMFETPTRLAAVLDWELSTLGHPLADVAHACMVWRTTPEEYGGVRGLDLEALGIPTEAEFVAAYCRAAGRERGPEPAHHAFAHFRMAVIFEGIAMRARQGNAASDDAAAVGELSTAFARRGLEAAAQAG